MDIKLITLKTNHTLIAKVEDPFDQSHIVVKEPLQVVMQPTKEGSSVMFVPFIEFAKEFKSGFKFSVQDILLISTPIEEIEEKYREVFSNIKIASSMPRV